MYQMAANKNLRKVLDSTFCNTVAIGKYHPDKYGTSSPRDRENAERLMKQVNEAYEALKDKAV